MVSVIVPCYNQGAYLSGSLESVYVQLYEDWECIIIDDGSADNSSEVAKQWVEKDGRFKYLHVANAGVSNARNVGIKNSSGTYILPLDGDDKISADFIGQAVREIEKGPAIKLVYSMAELFGDATGKWDFGSYDFKKMLHVNLICCTALYRRTDFDATTGYNINMKSGLEDWDFWLSLLKPADKVIKMKEGIFYYRRKKQSRSAAIDPLMDRKLKWQIFLNHTELYQEYFPDIISLYNENLLLKKWSFLKIKEMLRPLFGR